jgi:Transposase.
MGKQFDNEFKIKVVNDYKTDKYGGHKQVARKYNIDESTIWHWIEKDRKQGNKIMILNTNEVAPKKKI